MVYGHDLDQDLGKIKEAKAVLKKKFYLKLEKKYLKFLQILMHIKPWREFLSPDITCLRQEKLIGLVLSL